ncbi:TRAP transporter large permease [Oceanibacterium hippocampi]|uniref:TRAP transporter large permease protein n=1 Tax=Oceanibacterium hippocampi TaxID=745714 RepID=A0A1Y5U2I2_9PROT|nr:TRAP transporter large permease [Oceanibacterium hippocampi]SLN75609.1 Sialic acid TRAP transporter permease protein SiaT [Oceanibacterium hippocampi]
MDSILLLAGLIGLILAGAPIALAMIILPTIYILITDAAPLLTVPHQMYEALAKFPLVAIPFFMLTGELMNSSTVTERILRLSSAIVGRMRGGLAQVNVVASMFFAGMNGSAVADTATIGTIMIPQMKRRGYGADFAAAITAIGSTIGGIIPPSIAMIILASGANLSVGALFAGGVLPGLAIGGLLMLACWFIARIRGYERGEEAFSIAGLLKALKDAVFALIVPLVLVAGILGGWFSSVEAGAITAAVALAVGCLVYRSISLRGLFGAFDRTLRMSASVFVIIAAAGPFTWLLTRIGTLAQLESWLTSLAGSPLIFAMALLGLILVAGMLMDATANIIVLGPMLVATSEAAGFEPVQAAMVVVVGFLLGIVTPPVGVCYFTASAIAGAPLERVAIQLVPFLAIELLVLILMLAIAPFTLALPRVLGFI